MSDFQRVLRLFSTIFIISAVLAGSLTAADAYLYIPLADFLVKKLADIMFACVTACGGVIAGQQIEGRKHPKK